MLTDVRLAGQLIVSDQKFIGLMSCPYFGNTFVGSCYSSAFNFL